MKQLIIAMAVGLASIALPDAAIAHTSLSETNITSGSTVSELPDTLELTFAKPVGLAKVEFIKLGSEGNVELKIPRKMIKIHTVELPDFTAGEYVIKWRAVAQDGHVLNGEIAFTLAGS